MPINRGPWNALVDDDGSNLVGSVWNKAAIKTVILDPTDAALAPAWQSVPFAAGNFTASGGSGGTWTVAAGQVVDQKYMIAGQAIDVLITITGATLAGAPTQINIAGFPVNISATPNAMGLGSFAVGGWGPVMMSGTNAGGVLASRTDFAAIPAGAIYVYLSARFRIL